MSHGTIPSSSTASASPSIGTMGAVFDDAFDAMFVVSLDDERILDANPEACRLLGYARENLRGLSVQAVHPEEMPEVRAFATEVATRGRGRRDSLSCKTRDGELVPVEISASTFRLDERDCMLVIAHDMRRHRDRENRLRRARQEAEAADRAKVAFLANVGHELRTPLNAIIGFSSALEQELFGPLGDARYRDYAKGIHESGLHLHGLIRDLLNMARIQAGRFELVEDEVDLVGVIESCMAMLQAQTDTGALHLQASLSDGLPKLKADDCALRQIILNLLTNAAKFTPAGGHIELRAEADERGGICVSVSDDGPGIPESELERVMQPFAQGSTRQASGERGLGLGLPLARQLAELHGGRLDLASTPGQGATARLHLPAWRRLRVG